MRPRSRSGWLMLALWSSLVTSAFAPRAALADPSLEGTWYVLIHYRDDTTHDPQQLRWDDRLWVIERRGQDLEWTEYSIVLFDDDDGRFTRDAGHYARVLHAWEPSPSQLAQIRSGLQFNPRGAKKKTLRGDDAKGWTSGRASSKASANVVTYSETWSIAPSAGKPVFTRDDVLAAGTMDSAEGRTQYTTEAIESDGALLRGRFERDGTRHGTFRLMRSGAASQIRSDGKTPNEKLRELLEQRVRERLGKQGDAPVSPEEIDRLLREGGNIE